MDLLFYRYTYYSTWRFENKAITKRWIPKIHKETEYPPQTLRLASFYPITSTERHKNSFTFLLTRGSFYTSSTTNSRNSRFLCFYWFLRFPLWRNVGGGKGRKKKKQDERKGKKIKEQEIDKRRNTFDP